MTGRSLVRWVLAAISLASVLLPGSALAAFPGKNGKIAFVKGVCCNSYSASIYTMNPDGSEVTKLPDSDLSNLGPRWSADGKKIAFYTDHTDFSFTKAEIWTMNEDGTGRTRLTDNATDDTEPAWSPEGTEIAFTRRVLPSGRNSIYVMNSDGTNQRALPGGEGGARPAWSPDGKQIAFVEPTGYHEIDHLAVVPADGGEATALPLKGLDVSWSPDGKRIASTFVDAFTYWPGTIYVASADGSAPTTLSPATDYPDGPVSDLGPAWSPEGDKIAFAGCEPCVFDTGVPDHISTMSPDGGNRTIIATGYPIWIGNVDWQPIPGPRRADYRNAAAFCRAEREFLGADKFTARYGGRPNAFGRCVSQNKKRRKR